jgi:cysteine-rich repeat protein
VCVTGCSDGLRQGTEACDDGNIVPGDGCSPICRVETGFTCTGAPSTCRTTCGDGIKVGAEACDDRNIVNGDGCSSTCTVEPGFACTGSPSVCATVCGDGVRTSREECDDGNRVNGDCCSSTCTIERFCEREVNNTVQMPNDFAMLANGGLTNGVVNGFISPAGDRDMFRVTVPTNARGFLTAETIDSWLGQHCVNATMDTVVSLYNGAGQLLATDDDSGPGPCSVLSANYLSPGNYFIEVRASAVAATFGYTLRVTLNVAVCGNRQVEAGETCDDGNFTPGDGCGPTCQVEPQPGDFEPNNVCSSPSGPYMIPEGPVGRIIGGAINVPGDRDWFAFTTMAYTDLSFETFDSNGPGTCAAGVDTVIQMFRADCITGVGNPQDNGGIAQCSALNTTTQPGGPRHLPPGIWLLQVSAYLPNASFAYSLQARVLALCGDGVTQGSEQCDGTAGCPPDCTL